MPLDSITFNLEPHAASNTKGGGNSRKNRNDCLNYKFPSFFFHDFFVLEVNAALRSYQAFGFRSYRCTRIIFHSFILSFLSPPEPARVVPGSVQA